jgi:hypothetical protein
MNLVRQAIDCCDYWHRIAPRLAPASKGATEIGSLIFDTNTAKATLSPFRRE